MEVFKYYPPNKYSFDALRKEYFFFSKVKRLNDPFDCSYKLIKHTKLAQELINRRLLSDNSDMIMKEYGTCSFSSCRDSMHLWTFYAMDFTGFAIGFADEKFEELPSVFLNRILYYEVTYLDEMIDLDCQLTRIAVKDLFEDSEETCTIAEINACISDPKKLDMLFKYLCTIKYSHWKNEQERRLIVANDIIRNKEKLENKGVKYLSVGYNIPMVKDSITEIIAGHNMNPHYFRLLKCIAKYKKIPLYKTKVEQPFNIEFEKIDY